MLAPQVTMTPGNGTAPPVLIRGGFVVSSVVVESDGVGQTQVQVVGSNGNVPVAPSQVVVYRSAGEVLSLGQWICCKK